VFKPGTAVELDLEFSPPPGEPVAPPPGSVATGMDWDGSGLLDGLEGETRDARRRLLERLAAQGVPEEELRRACEEDRLVLLPLERELSGPLRYTAEEIAERSGLSQEWLERVRRASGLSIPEREEVAFTEQDLEAARRFKSYMDAGLPTDDLVSSMRVIGSSLARSAEAVREVSGPALLEPGIAEDELARRYGATTETLLPLVEEDLSYLLRIHLREQLRQFAISHTELSAGELARTSDTVVAFADLVGFTELGEERDPEALGDVAALLLEHAEAVIESPVRLVKSIGDAVMLVSSEPVPLLHALLDLIDAAEADERLPPLRGGVATGPALQRFGDFYGGTVNVAARLCSRARPGSLLVSEKTREGARDGFSWSSAGPKKLKGVGTLDTWRARRADASEE
jgi:adenylate cyclase